MFKKSLILMSVIFAVFSASIVSFAEDEASGRGNPGDKLVNGLINILTGWAELPRNVVDSMKTGNLGAVLEDGVIKGTFYALLRTATGILDAATFVIPPYDKPLMEPLWTS